MNQGSIWSQLSKIQSWTFYNPRQQCAVEVQVFTVAQIPLQFHCIFYRQTMQILNVKTAKKYLQWVVCKKYSETAVGFVPQ